MKTKKEKQVDDVAGHGNEISLTRCYRCCCNNQYGEY